MYVSKPLTDTVYRGLFCHVSGWLASVQWPSMGQKLTVKQHCCFSEIKRESKRNISVVCCFTFCVSTLKPLYHVCYWKPNTALILSPGSIGGWEYKLATIGIQHNIQTDAHVVSYDIHQQSSSNHNGCIHVAISIYRSVLKRALSTSEFLYRLGPQARGS
jgi:hypothetical protein